MRKFFTMKHTMKLQDAPFRQIASGQKTIELRLDDEKRRLIAVGDEIEFSHTVRGDLLRCRVKALHRFPTFAALYASLPLLQCGYTVDTVKDASPADMEHYYAVEEQKRYGVLGIELALIENNE